MIGCPLFKIHFGSQAMDYSYRWQACKVVRTFETTRSQRGSYSHLTDCSSPNKYKQKRHATEPLRNLTAPQQNFTFPATKPQPQLNLTAT